MLATQTLILARPKAMAVEIGGALPAGISAKDLALFVVAALGTAEARGLCGGVPRRHSVQALGTAGRMTLCNPRHRSWSPARRWSRLDEVTIRWIRGRERCARGRDFSAAPRPCWRTLSSDAAATSRPGRHAGRLRPRPDGDLGHRVRHTAVPITGTVPDPADLPDGGRADRRRRMLE